MQHHHTDTLHTVVDTLFVNLFGGPGCAKSTTAAGVFYKLKTEGCNSELIAEYAKDKTWGEDMFTLSCQPYVTSKQLYRQYRVMGKVDVAVTDSPFILGLVYPGFGATESWKKGVFEQFELFNNVNIFLQRNSDVHPYNPKGRSQTQTQAEDKDADIRSMLDSNNVPYHLVKVSSGMQTVDEIYKIITNI